MPERYITINKMPAWLIIELEKSSKLKGIPERVIAGQIIESTIQGNIDYQRDVSDVDGRDYSMVSYTLHAPIKIVSTKKVLKDNKKNSGRPSLQSEAVHILSYHFDQLSKS